MYYFLCVYSEDTATEICTYVEHERCSFSRCPCDLICHKCQIHRIDPVQERSTKSDLASNRKRKATTQLLPSTRKELTAHVTVKNLSNALLVSTVVYRLTIVGRKGIDLKKSFCPQADNYKHSGCARWKGGETNPFLQ